MLIILLFPQIIFPCKILNSSAKYFAMCFTKKLVFPLALDQCGLDLILKSMVHTVFLQNKARSAPLRLNIWFPKKLIRFDLLTRNISTDGKRMTYAYPNNVEQLWGQVDPKCISSRWALGSKRLPTFGRGDQKSWNFWLWHRWHLLTDYLFQFV